MMPRRTGIWRSAQSVRRCPISARAGSAMSESTVVVMGGLQLMRPGRRRAVGRPSVARSPRKTRSSRISVSPSRSMPTLPAAVPPGPRCLAEPAARASDAAVVFPPERSRAILTRRLRFVSTMEPRSLSLTCYRRPVRASRARTGISAIFSSGRALQRMPVGRLWWRAQAIVSSGVTIRSSGMS